ncbi:hypothetical protein [Neptunomonas antarctica]
MLFGLGLAGIARRKNTKPSNINK